MKDHEAYGNDSSRATSELPVWQGTSIIQRIKTGGYDDLDM